MNRFRFLSRYSERQLAAVGVIGALVLTVLINVLVHVFVPVKVAAQPAPATQVVTPAPTAAPKSAPLSAVERVPGSSEDNPAYQCTAAPVQVPVGETKLANGATYKLAQSKSYSYQESVQLTIRLPKGVAAPVAIVNTAAHNIHPDVYPQYLLRLALEPGAKGNYTLYTDGYAENYMETGITDVTLCTTIPQ